MSPGRLPSPSFISSGQATPRTTRTIPIVINHFAIKLNFTSSPCSAEHIGLREHPVPVCCRVDTLRNARTWLSSQAHECLGETMPLIAMTREMGSLGKDVAAEVAQRLGRSVVHHEIIDNVASKMRLRKSHVVRFLEGKSGIWERMTTDKTSLSIYTADELFALAEDDHIGIIRGWGAAHLLRNCPHIVAVR